MKYSHILPFLVYFSFGIFPILSMPTITSTPSDINVETQNSAGIRLPNTTIDAFLKSFSAVDIQSNRPLAVTPDNSGTFPIGVTNVTFTAAADSSGDIAKFSANVTVFMSNITTPLDIKVDAQSAAGTPATDAKIKTFLNSVTAVDSGNGDDLKVTPAPGTPTTFPFGVTKVFFDAETDSRGIAPRSAANVTVIDSTPPELIVPFEPKKVSYNPKWRKKLITMTGLSFQE